MPIYKYRHSETVDHIHTLYLTDQEVNLIENFRDASENDRQMLLIFSEQKTITICTTLATDYILSDI